MTIKFIGDRRKDFTTIGAVTGAAYYVTPHKPFEVDPADGAALLTDPTRWAEVKPPEKAKK